MLPVRVFNSSAISSQQFFFRCINNNSSSSFFGSFRKHVDVDEHLNFPKCIVLLFLLLFLATHCRHTHRRERWFFATSYFFAHDRLKSWMWWMAGDNHCINISLTFVIVALSFDRLRRIKNVWILEVSKSNHVLHATKRQAKRMKTTSSSQVRSSFWYERSSSGEEKVREDSIQSLDTVVQYSFVCLNFANNLA